MSGSLIEQILGRTLKMGGKRVTDFLPSPTNEEETYVARIKKDLHIDDYADAMKLYASDPAYWQQYYRPLPRLDPARERIRDSAAMAGVPSRNNVFEYGFPENNSAGAAAPRSDAGTAAPSNAGQQDRFLGSRKLNSNGEAVTPWQFPADNNPAATIGNTNSGSPAFQSGAATYGQIPGAPPVGFLPATASSPLQGGVGSWSSSVSPAGPLYVTSPETQPDQPAGLPGMLLEYLRNNPNL